MALLKQLLEMDPMMRPIGGPVCPPNTPIQSTTEQPDCVVPDRNNNLLRRLMYRTAAEEEESLEQDGEEESTNQTDNCSEVITFIKNYEDPSVDDIEHAAKQCGMNVEEFVKSVFDVARSLLNGVGKHDDIPDEDFDAEQLQMGIEVEMEHTNNTMIAKMIAKDHLMEFPDYYSRLKQAEKD